MSWPAVLAVFLGGGIGSVARFGLSFLLKSFGHSTFPLATLLANLLSTALLGWLVWRSNLTPGTNTYLFLSIGFCGGFSTFSTFSLETFQLIKSDQFTWAASNILISVLGCLALLLILSKHFK